MNGASVAYGLRAALSNHQGTALHRFAVDALDLLARCAPELARLDQAASYHEKVGSDGTVEGDDVAQASAFAAAWKGYPNAGPTDVMAGPIPQLDLEPRFYVLDYWRPHDQPQNLDTTLPALGLVPDGHGVVHVEPMTRQNLAFDPPRTVWGSRLYVDRRPGVRG